MYHHCNSGFTGYIATTATQNVRNCVSIYSNPEYLSGMQTDTLSPPLPAEDSLNLHLLHAILL